MADDENMNKKRSKGNKTQIIFMLVFILIGGLCGFVGGMLLLDKPSSAGGGGVNFFELILMFLLVIVAFYLQTIIHEGGHLVCGLLTGYHFVSFRVDSLMIQKSNGKYEIRKFMIPGTGGQCLLDPPDVSYEKMPYKLYFFGGVLLNLITSVIAGIGFFVSTAELLKVFWAATCFIGVVYVLLNGIPMNTGVIINDAYNVVDLSKNAYSKMGLWIQLKTNAKNTDGVRLKDMPDEWFQMPEDADFKNVNFTSGAVFYENRFMDQHDFVSARAMIERLLSDESKIVGLYDGLLKLDQFYIDLIEQNGNADVSIFEEQIVKTLLKQMKDVPFAIRSCFAKAIYEGDTSAKEKALAHFEKMAPKYPAKAEVVSERELIELLKERYEKK